MRSLRRHVLTMGSHNKSISSMTYQAVSRARLSHDVYTTSNSNPCCFRLRPAILASSIPSSANGASSHPVNKPSLLCCVLPWRIMTITESCRFCLTAEFGTGVTQGCAKNVGIPSSCSSSSSSSSWSKALSLVSMLGVNVGDSETVTSAFSCVMNTPFPSFPSSSSSASRSMKSFAHSPSSRTALSLYKLRSSPVMGLVCRDIVPS
mmetsp:Transcript_4281/g.10198  ORF Transcript_4281/g.10198 Transcript_4281/m.10198 type:complete len:206 (+) Transcript_4281:1753-2370(+)